MIRTWLSCSRFPARREASHEPPRGEGRARHRRWRARGRVHRSERNVGGGGQPSEGTANAAERPRARVQRRSGVRLGQAPDGNANPAGTEVLESSTTSNGATRWPTREGCALRWWRSCCERHGAPRWSPGGSKGGRAPLAGGPSMRGAPLGRTADTPGRNYFPGRRREPASGNFAKEAARGTGVPQFKPGFPAFEARSSRVQSSGRKRRSCSPG